MAKPFAWSYSALTSFETCPKQHYHLRIAKDVKEAPSPHIDWGKRVHSALEYRILNGSPLPDTMKQYEPLAASIMAKEGIKSAETRICLNENLQPTGFFDRDAWVRGVVDVSIARRDKMFMGDWKTGKRNPESAQLRLSAAMGFAMYPQVTTIVTAFLWLQDGKTDHETFQRGDAPAIWQEFMPRVQRMQHAIATGSFPPRPSGLCRKHCPIVKCEHNGQFAGVKDRSYDIGPGAL